MAEMTLPEAVSQDLQHRLLEPFDSEASAKEFWDETSSALIILNPHDSMEDLKVDEVWTQLEFTLTYPEYTVPLCNDYQLLVAIVNDSGAGIYLVIPPELSHIIPQEVNTHE
jgi:hypothetical protein